MRVIKEDVDVSAVVDVSVELSLEDIREALDVAIFESEIDKTKYPVMMFVRGLYDCMRAVTDEMIDRLPPEDRRRIVKAIDAETDRFRVGKEKP